MAKKYTKNLIKIVAKKDLLKIIKSLNLKK